MQHIEATTYTYAKGSCYRCGSASDLVDMDAHIEGEGALAICSTCIFEAATLARAGRSKMRKRAREDERERLLRERDHDEHAEPQQTATV